MLYRLIDEAGVLLYVGMTSGVNARLNAHARLQPWWPRVASCRLEMFESRAALAAAELLAIESEHPVYTKLVKPEHNRRERVVVSKLVPTATAAYELGVSRETLWRWQKNGSVTPVVVTPGGQARWDVRALMTQLSGDVTSERE
jgi:hypothetical protein